MREPHPSRKVPIRKPQPGRKAPMREPHSRRKAPMGEPHPGSKAPMREPHPVERKAPVRQPHPVERKASAITSLAPLLLAFSLVSHTAQVAVLIRFVNNSKLRQLLLPLVGLAHIPVG